MRKTIFLLFVSSVCFSVGLPGGVTPKCEKQTSEELKRFKSKDNWFRVADTVPGHKTFRTATQKFGQWIELNDGEVASLHIVNDQGIKEIKLNPTNCETKISTAFYKDKVLQGSGINYFTDDDFLKLINAKESLLIYTWSPRMIYSVKLMNDFAEIAQKLHMKFVPLLDPEVSLEETKQLVGRNFKYKIQKVASNEIIMREMITHYPSTLVVYKGEIVDPFILGVMPKLQLEYQINQRLINKQGLGK